MLDFLFSKYRWYRKLRGGWWYYNFWTNGDFKGHFWSRNHDGENTIKTEFYGNSSKQSFDVDAQAIQTDGGARLILAYYSKQIIETKWWQFKKRRRLYDQATAIAKKHNIEF